MELEPIGLDDISPFGIRVVVRNNNGYLYKNELYEASTQRVDVGTLVVRCGTPVRPDARRVHDVGIVLKREANGFYVHSLSGGGLLQWNFIECALLKHPERHYTAKDLAAYRTILESASEETKNETA